MVLVTLPILIYGLYTPVIYSAFTVVLATDPGCGWTVIYICPAFPPRVARLRLRVAGYRDQPTYWRLVGGNAVALPLLQYIPLPGIPGYHV